MTDFTVDKVLFERQKAVGVTVVAENISKQIMAAREVILSAGAINSPQILLRSGIGPKEDLEAKGIKIIQNLSGVGKNLQDHIGVVSQFACTEPVTLARSATPLRTSERNMRDRRRA